MQQTERALEWRQLLLLLVLSALFLLPVLRHPEALIYPTYATHSDLATIHWPKATLQAGSVRHYRQWPLWTPRILGGMPLAANPLAMSFYPAALLFLVLPAGAAFNLLWAIHLWLAGAGAYLWLRRAVNVSSPAATLGALTFAFTGKMVAHMAAGHVTLVGAVAWLPWALYFVDRAVTRGSRRAALLGGAALALQATTHSQIFLYTIYLVLAYGLVAAILPGVNRREKNRAGRLGLLALVFVVTGMLAAVQLLPLAEMATYSNRALSAGEASAQALTPVQLIVSLLLPTGQGGHEPVLYVGLAPLLLLPFAWARWRHWQVAFYAGLALFALLFALGNATPLYPLLRWLPGLTYTRTPARAGFLLALAVASLAANGFDALVSATWTGATQRRWRLAALGIAATGMSAGLGLGLLAGAPSRATWGLALFPALGIVFISTGRQLAAHRPWILAAGLGALIVADLWSFDGTLWQATLPEKAFAPGDQVAAWLAAQPGQFRVYSPGYTIEQQVAAQYDLELADGIEPVHLAAYDRYAGLATGVPVEGFSVTVPPFPEDADLATAHQDAVPHPGLLGLLNVRYLVAAFDVQGEGWVERARFGEIRAFENLHAMPRAFVVGQVEPVRDGDQALAQLATMDLHQTALVKDGLPLSGGTAFKEATVSSQSPNRIEVTVELAAPGFLVLSEVWYPGWQASDNGKPLQIYRTWGLLRGVYLEQGMHRLTFTYRPSSVRAGGIISGLSALALAGYLGWTAVRARRAAL